MNEMNKRIGNLMSVKSIITIVCTAVFAYLAISHTISSSDFMTIYGMIIAFYFGTQLQKGVDKQ